MSKISSGISPRGSVDLTDASPSGFREFMRASLDGFLRQVPGNSINEKLPHLARTLGFREGRLNEYRHRKVNRPYADEVWAVLQHAENLVSGNERRAELRRNSEDLKNAFSGVGDPAGRQASLLRISGNDVCEQRGCGAGPELAATVSPQALSLGRFAGGILDVQKIGLGRANSLHQRLVEAADQTAGEFTVAVWQEMERLGLADLTWLYRDNEALPTRHIGAGIKILSPADRARAIDSPLADQALPPSILSLVSEHLHACMRTRARPTVHRIKASICGEIVTYDRLAMHFPKSGLVASACLMVAA